MKVKNLIYALYDQMLRPGAWRNIFVTHNAFGIFSRYSHVSRATGRPKISYPSKAGAQKAAEAMSPKRGVHFSVYKCVWCDGWHIGKNAQNKIEQETGTFVNRPNALYERLKPLGIVDLAPVYGSGVRGRTLSGRGSVRMLKKVREAGGEVVIDLRTRDYTDRFPQNVADAGLEYFHIPIDRQKTDVHEIIAALPGLFERMDKGGFYMACAMGLHRTDIAIASYYVLHPSVPIADVPEMRGHRKDGKFRCEDIATRLNSIMRGITPDELKALGLPPDYEKEFSRRKKRLFDANRAFQDP